jgi:hypothetical protein
MAPACYPDFLQRWFSEDDLDLRQDLAIGEQILTFLKPHGGGLLNETPATRKSFGRFFFR